MLAPSRHTMTTMLYEGIVRYWPADAPTLLVRCSDARFTRLTAEAWHREEISSEPPGYLHTETGSCKRRRMELVLELK